MPTRRTTWIALTLAAALMGRPAHAEPPTCTALAPLPQGELVPMAWVTRAGVRVGWDGVIEVTDAAALRAWAQGADADVGRLLQRLGQRRKPVTPRRPWKVPPASLCRPQQGLKAGEDAAGAPACARPRLPGRDDGCGRAFDRAEAAPEVTLWRVRWSDAAARGFCVLPLDRWLAGR